MPFFVWCEIVCNGCASTIAGQHTSGQVPRKQMAKEAKEDGWERAKRNEWMCRWCLKKPVSQPENSE